MKPSYGHIGNRPRRARTGYRSAPVAPKRVEVEIEGRVLSLSNLDKVLYPRAGFAKGQSKAKPKAAAKKRAPAKRAPAKKKAAAKT